MKTLFACLGVLCALASPAFAASHPSGIRHIGGSSALQSQAVSDTLLLMGPHGSGAAVIGTFESAAGTADWNGWTSADLTQETSSQWHAATFNAVSGTYSAWCGSEEILSCGPGDLDGGYGRNLDELLEWRATVSAPALPCTVSLNAVINIGTMDGYDYFFVSCAKTGLPQIDLFTQDGHHDDLPVSVTAVYQPGDYVGPNADEVVLRFRVTSDGGWDGQDCLWPNEGAVQLDDLTIELSNGTGYSHDFEDGTLGDLQPVFRQGVGDFAQLWSRLVDLDPCVENPSPQVAFIDDGLVVPGTGGSACIQWCYGPYGYAVNTTGGLAEDATIWDQHQLDNAVESPPLVWGNPGHDGALLSFSLYRHAPYIPGDSPLVACQWAVRSVATGDPADLADAPWRFRDGGYLGGPFYSREQVDVRDLLEPGRTHVQVRFRAYEADHLYGWDGHNATPAPYVDNVSLKSYPAAGPTLAATADGLANDAFPAGGTVDLVALGNNSVAFDAAGFDPARAAGADSLTITCAPCGEGTALVGPPQLIYRTDRNPAFAAHRTSGLPASGSVDCAPTGGGPDRWAADLPDVGFLFPGDRLHYYFRATQDRGGELTTAILPADTTGFDRFGDGFEMNGGYDAAFAVRGLPTVSEVAGAPGTYRSSRFLFWHDSGTDDDWATWLHAWNQTGLLNADLDVFHTQSAVSGLYNGLGARATAAQLAGYEVIVYTSGRMSAQTLDTGSSGLDGRSPDLAVIGAWLQQGGKNLLAFGNDLASDLQGSSLGSVFLSDWFAVTLDGPDISPFLGGQTSPLVLAAPGNPVLQTAGSWLAYGASCSSPAMAGETTALLPDRFDAVTAGPGAVRLAVWTDPGGSPGTYAQAAAVLASQPSFNARAILVPMDFRLVRTADNDKVAAPEAARTRLLLDGLSYFVELPGPIDPTPVPVPGSFAVDHFPNPFNPSTTIKYTVDHPGRLIVKVYNLQGQLVRVLHDGQVQAGGTLIWDGTGADGEAAASGIYFYEARLGHNVQVGKMALIK